jgi:hypothetical protein
MFSLGRRGPAVGRGRGEKKEKGGEDSRLHLTYINRRESLVGSGYGERNENCRKRCTLGGGMMGPEGEEEA